MGVYDRMVASANRQLDKFGRSVILRQYSEGSIDYDPETGIASPQGGSSTDETRRALVLDQPGSQIQMRFGDNMQKGTLIQKGEKWLYLDTNGARPAQQDKLIIDGVEYAIVDVQETAPGGVVILYMLVIRR